MFVILNTLNINVNETMMTLQKVYAYSVLTRRNARKYCFCACNLSLDIYSKDKKY